MSQAITTLYNAINPDKSRDSHTFWMVACGVVSSVIVLKVGDRANCNRNSQSQIDFPMLCPIYLRFYFQAYLLYNIIMSSAFFVHFLLYYGAIGLGLFGAGLGVSSKYTTSGQLPVFARQRWRNINGLS